MTFEITISGDTRKSCYFDQTVRDGVRSFQVYNHMYLPTGFGDPEAEYDRLLNGVAMWDVAAERQVEITGPDAALLVQYLTPRNLENTAIGQGRYVPICDHDGFLINDPVLLKLSDEKYWLSVADSDIHLWAQAVGRERGWEVQVCEPDVSPLAIQGPKAEDVTASLLGDWVRGLRYFGFQEFTLDGIPMLVARSGWSKQGGFELYLTDSSLGGELWDRVKAAGAPFDIGPGAPNGVERLESGLVSYGSDMRRQTLPATPFELGLGMLVDLDAGHDFIGRNALLAAAAQPPERTRVGILVKGTPTLPGHPLPIWRDGQKVGVVTGMAYSSRVGATIAVGMIQSDLADSAEELSLLINDTAYPASLHPVPFL
ncbi:Dimethylsulfonioproprionate demethylase DmdA [Tritonibacter multivorans]|uniref:Dimethylsulfonioproprionate demethylase DmdA n=1 Tax=Tritonibacter multivorans TaxID=928856 RepID=A0A0P1GGU2_9RHOB|nr:glycine cleavage T C-terminal barrel domain-containing protein [Tritonibacter multivorans]MDA7420693.1 glycine cleavage system protein T [Tritonibacter multivorans]CUH81115.1 Dimethylsulfonioproprionate demethylase DmdA [Tritonibacter multivorans]SFC28609.1 aminomethyltransferase [Tritonibacter multivorans]